MFKSGDVNDMGNFRGITVTPALAKLFAMLLKARITEFTESHHLRAQGLTEVAKPPVHVWICTCTPEIALACGHGHMQNLLTMRGPVIMERTV